LFLVFECGTLLFNEEYVMGITSSSVLVELNMSVWSANKLDRGETDKLTADNSAVRDAAQVRKNLMAGTSMRKDIEELASAARRIHTARTLPWADRGARLLPTSLFMEYKAEMNKIRSQFYAMVDNFVDKYPALVQTAQNYMGGLFNPNDYPSADEIRTKFGFKLTFSPVPEAGDFRLDVPAADLIELSSQYEDSFNTRMADAMKEPWERLHKVLSHMSEKLTEQDTEARRLYHDTLVSNAVDLCGMLTHLNVTKDPKLEEARRQLEEAMVGANIDMIRESSTTRASMKDKVDSILKQFEW
jgi:hypothetical protein